MDGDYLIPPKATAWCKARKVPVINEALQRELVRVAEAAVRAIHDDDGEIPREVRVYYQALKYVAAVAGAPEGRKWYGYGTEGVAGKETGLTTEQLKAGYSDEAERCSGMSPNGIPG